MIKAYINSNGAIKSGIKTADDSVDVLDKMDMSLIKIENGKIIYPTYGDAVSKNSKTKKGSEILTEKKKIAIDEFNKTYYEPFRDDPYTADHDGDGLKDDMDPDPLNAFDNRFELVNKYDADPYELFPKYVLHGEDEDDQDGYDQTYLRWYNSDYQTAKRENNTEIMNRIKEEYLGTKIGFQALRTLGILFGNISGDNLGRFLDKSFEKNEVVDIGTNAIERATGESKGGRFGFYTCMNVFFECAEDTVISGKTLSLSSRTEKDYLLPGTEIWSVNTDSWFKDYIINSPKTLEELDILLGTSSYHNAIVAENITCFEKNKKTYYKANVRFYLLDFYDYNNIRYIGDLQEAGLATPYLYSSCKEMEITWEKGKRMPKYNSYIEVNLWDEYGMGTGVSGIDGIDIKCTNPISPFNGHFMVL